MAEETDHIEARNEHTSDQLIVRHDSDENTLVADNRVAVVPHYLRASTGSCHDACKYGKPHVFKEKPWKARRISFPAYLPDAEKTVEIRIFLDKQVKKSVESDRLARPSKQAHSTVDKGRRSSPLLRRSPIHDSSIFLKNEAPTTVDKVRRSRPFFGRSPIHDSSKLLKNEATPTADKQSKNSSLLRRSPVHDSSKLLKNEVKLIRKSPSPEPPRIMKKPIQSPGRLFFPDASKLSRQEVSSAAKKDVPVRRTSSAPKGRVASAGPLRQTGIAPWSPDIFTGSQGKKSSETKFSGVPRSSSKFPAGKGLTPAATTLSVKRSPKLEVKKPLETPSTTMHSLRSSGVGTARSSHAVKTESKSKIDERLIRLSTTKNQISTSIAEPVKPANETADEKTVHMIETKEESLPSNPSACHFVQSPPLSPKSLNSSSQADSLSFTSTEIDEQYELDTDYTDSNADESVSNFNGVGDAKAVESMQCSSRTACSSGDQDPTSLKLKFRRGKVVELGTETNSTRKLRFRQGKTLIDGDADSGSQRKSFRKTAGVIGEKEADGGPEQVALKHQEVMTKDEQVSLNNVIEETASELAKKKKSKVKALVGAFETVILLQERKPSSANS